MGENTKIEWATHTFNPWMGCAKVSEACRYCYAERDMDHRYGRVQWGKNGTRVQTSRQNWAKPRRWNREAAESGKRPRVFCASLADVFEDRLELKPWRANLFELIQETPHLDWLLLTKRPENICPMLTEAGIWNKLPLDNVWFGTSVENQQAADQRIPELLQIPAVVRFLSCEPLLSLLDLSSYLKTSEIHWIITGGESGPKARPSHPQWFRDLRYQATRMQVAFFFKQWGEWGIAEENPSIYLGIDGSLTANPSLLATVPMFRYGKKANGRLLDGQLWSEIPR